MSVKLVHVLMVEHVNQFRVVAIDVFVVQALLAAVAKFRLVFSLEMNVCKNYSVLF